jgi:hypothetical protein
VFKSGFHVGLFDPHEALDGRPVEHDLPVERLLELPVGDLDVLDAADDVAELQAHELHAFTLGGFQDLRLQLLGCQRRLGSRRPCGSNGELDRGLFGIHDCSFRGTAAA